MVVGFGIVRRPACGIEIVVGAYARGERQTRIERGAADPELRGHAVAMVVGHVALIDPTPTDADIRGERVPIIERPGERLCVAAARENAAAENGQLVGVRRRSSEPDQHRAAHPGQATFCPEFGTAPTP